MNAQVQHVHTFQNTFLCFMRPRKRTFCVLQWVPASGARSGRWSPYTGQILNQHCTLHRSLAHPTRVHVKLYIGSRTGIYTQEVKYDLNGDYILWSLPGATPRAIPILGNKISGAPWPPSFTNADTLKDISMNHQTYNTQEILWTLQPEENLQQILHNISSTIHNQQQQQRPAVVTIPPRIAKLIAEDASMREEMCPITMETINPQTAKVTSCYHVFDGQAIDEWLSTKSTCPVCKQDCTVTSTVLSS